MSKEKMTKAEAQAWVDSRVWANGWDCIADPTIDAVEFATQYAENKEIWDAMFKWLAETDPKTLTPGKIEIIPKRLWFNILEYTPKSAEDTKIESHKNYIDLQYTYEGNELMGLAHSVIPTGDYDPVKDKTNYRTEEKIDYVPADPKRFFLYFPADMHQPSVRSIDNPGVSHKIVGKIEYVK